jgi:translation elongation factor EF-1beta
MAHFLALIESVGFACESIKFAEAEKNYILKLNLTPEEEAMLREENAKLKKQVEDLQKQMKDLMARVGKLEVSGGGGGGQKAESKPAPAKKDDDDDVDLFGSDEEDDAEAARIKEERLAAYAAKKSNKPAVIAKSNVILDVKPWDDETDMGEMEKKVRSIEMPGLLWGSSKLVPVGYGIKKLQISCVVEDDKVSIDELSEKIEAFEDFVQSIDVAAFNKI